MDAGKQTGRRVGLATITVAMAFFAAACGSAGTMPATASPFSTSSPSTAAPTPNAVASLAASPATPTPQPLRAVCSGSSPCVLAAGTWVTTGDGSFMPGLSITLPAGWQTDEQDAGEFNLFRMEHPDDALKLWKDVVPVTSDGTTKVVAGIPRTQAGLTGYLRGNPDFVVSKATDATIDGGLPATTYVVGVSKTARFTDPGCPVFPHCADLLTDPVHWGPNVYGIGAPEVVRLYLATVGSGTETHLFVVALDAPNEAELVRFTAVAAPIIASIRLPAGL